ncbi:hypothetical protein HET73_01310 [Wolbachia endosymbiont of Atemnus politus]|uniref:hypothetical protein n=1 Tax=Wolbachia endosymbiont of Atemnus politus TaxID=2682840 RepID=UPI001571A4EE|nr:hypothetical protein [Wolbachia endosymbiont of Atemnus politus]NSM56280.1 hypothetical protein [Wolbachia endosymbiont of Atemnus politus]
MVGYLNKLSEKAVKHSIKIADFIYTTLSYAVNAVIWAAALVVTPLIWAVDKVSSKFSESNTEAVNPNGKAPAQ